MCKFERLKLGVMGRKFGEVPKPYMMRFNETGEVPITKSTKIITSIFIIALLSMLSLIACGDDSDETPEPTNDLTQSPMVTPTSKPTPIVTPASTLPPTSTQIPPPTTSAILTPDPGIIGKTVVHQGMILEDTIWQNEVLIEDSVVVPSGVTLKIEPGTHVEFKHYRGYKEPENRLRIDVLGTLIADGTPDAPIYFTSDAPDPQNGDWSMIHLRNSGKSIFRYCVVEFGQQGINVWGTAPTISHCIIRWNNWEGLYFESYSEPTIGYTRIYENGYNGLAAEQFNVIKMDHCEVWSNGTHGIHIDASTCQISRSLVHDNLAGGLSADNNSAMTVLGVAIENNQDCGIVFGEGHNSVDVSNLTFDGNQSDVCGAYNEFSSSVYAPEQIDFTFHPDQSYSLGYTPGHIELDQYMYTYPDDETRCIKNKIGEGLGLTWSLAWDGEYIWSATLWGIIYKLDPRTGDIIQQFNTTMSQPWGMTFDGEYLWVVDFAEKRFAKIDPSTGEELATYTTPDPIGGCKGITWDGSYLYLMGWTSSTIYQMDRKGNLINTIELSEGGGGGIACDGNHFWVPSGGRIRKYDNNGHALGWIYAASEGTWDLTWDGKYLWASQRTNENWQDAKIFQLEILNDHSWNDLPPEN